MPNLPHRAARCVRAVSDNCVFALLMLPIVIAHAAVNAPWKLYRLITGGRRPTHTSCPGCPYCDVILTVRLPKDLH